VSVVDWIIAGAAVLAGYRGWRRGALGQLFSFLGRGVGLLIALRYLPRAVASITHHFTWWEPSFVVGGVLLCGAVSALAARLIARRLLKLLPLWKIEVLDSVLGMTVGLAGVVLVCWLASGVVQSAPPESTVTREAAHSVVLRDMARLLPKPPQFPTFGQLIRNAHLPTSVARLGAMTNVDSVGVDSLVR
jgi:hypothetical protein